MFGANRNSSSDSSPTSSQSREAVTRHCVLSNEQVWPVQFYFPNKTFAFNIDFAHIITFILSALELLALLL